MQRPDAPAATVREHYTQVCLCEWEDHAFTRRTTSAACSMHGNVPDPLAALETEFVALLAVESAARDTLVHGLDHPAGQIEMMDGSFKPCPLCLALDQLKAVRGG